MNRNKDAELQIEDIVLGSHGEIQILDESLLDMIVGAISTVQDCLFEDCENKTCPSNSACPGKDQGCNIDAGCPKPNLGCKPPNLGCDAT